MADIELLPLPDWGGAQIIPDNLIKDYALANVAHATAPLQAEIEALRAKWIRAEEQLAACDSDLHEMQRRAERLAEAVRRVTAAFRAHGEASHECEAAMLSLADAIEAASA